jgi:hypothetical protein
MESVSKDRRLCAAAWFALLGFTVSALLFLHRPMHWNAVYLYLLLPAFSGGLTGYLWGGAILDSSRAKNMAEALLRGVGVTAASFAIFSLLFAVVYSLTEKSFPIPQVFSLFLTTLGLGVVIAGPVMAVVGILGTVLLYIFGRRVFHPATGGRD